MPTTTFVPANTPLFPNPAAAVADLRAELAIGVLPSYPGLAAATDQWLWNKLVAAEADAEKKLRTFFSPTEVIPDDADPSEVAALEAAGTRYYQEAAYDYDPDFFRGERWGYIVTNIRPVISVHSIQLAYPAPTSTIFNIPTDWFRLDRKYGHIRLVPATSAFAAPLSAFLMQALGGGKTIPMMIRVRYQAGLTNASGANTTSYATVWQDLIDVVKKMAILMMVQSAFPAGSESISADGLSQSRSVKLSDWQDMINEKLFGSKGSNGGLYAAIHGVSNIVLGF